jgi:hypothetical protein
MTGTPPNRLTAPETVGGFLADLTEARLELEEARRNEARYRDALAGMRHGLADGAARIAGIPRDVLTKAEALVLQCWSTAANALDGAAGGREADGEYPPVPVPAAAWVTLDDLAAAIGRSMPRVHSIERADGWAAARVEDPREFAWRLLQQCAGWDPDAEPPAARAGLEAT